MRVPVFKSIRFKLIGVMMLVASSTALMGYLAFLS
jgi:ABC-type enterochelin transport system permease subunit